MKHFLIFIIISGFSNCLSAQSSTSHHYRDFSGKLYSVNGFKFAENRVSNFFSDSTYILGYSPNGTKKFSKHLNFSYPAKINDAIPSTDNCLILVGSYLPKCMLQNNNGCFIIKIDTSGNTQELNAYDDIGGNLFPNAYKSIIYNDFWEGYQVFNENEFIVYDNTLEQIMAWQTTFGIVNAATYVSDQTFINNSIVSGTVTTNNLSNIDQIGNVNFFEPINYSLKKMFGNSQKDIYTLSTNGFIYKYDTLLNEVANTSTLTSGFQFSDITLKEDTIYACATNSLSIVKFDKDLNVVYQKDHLFPGINYSAISVSQNSITLIGTEAYTPLSIHKNYIFTNTGLNGNIDLTNDASIEDYTISTYTLEPNQGSAYNNFTYQLLVKIFNHSSNVLQSVYVNHAPRQYEGCYEYYAHHYFDNLNIAPSSFAYVTTPIVGDLKFIPSNPTSNDSITMSNYCVWTSVPNFNGDSNHNNDALCKQLTLPVITSVSKHNEVSENVIIYPNPTSGSFTIDLPMYIETTNHELKISNILGETVYPSMLIDKKTTIDISAMCGGIYFVSLYESGKLISMKKIVKQN